MSASVVAVGLVAARMFALFRTVPFLGAGRAPAPLHLALAVGLGVALAPGVGIEFVPSAPVVAVLAVKEALVGFALGFVASLPFRFAEASGGLVDASRSSSLSSSSIAGAGSTTPTGNLLSLGSIAVLFVTPAHVAFMRGVDASLDAVPVIWDTSTGPATVETLATTAIGASAGLLASSVMIALPVLASVLLVDVAIGAAGRFVPHSGGTFTFMPLRSVVGLLALSLSLTVLSPVLAGLIASTMELLGAG